MSDRTFLCLAFLLSLGVAALLYACTAFMPLQSEDWNHLERIGTFTSFRDALDPSISHARPLLFLSLYALVKCGLASPHELRIPSYLLHAVAGWAVAGLALSLSGSRARATVALVLFLGFPAVKALSWIMALSTPGHVAFMLLALWMAVLHMRRPGAWSGLALLGAQVLALGFHQAALVLPALVAAIVLAIAPRERRKQALFDRWLIAHALVGVVYVVVVGSLGEDQRHHGLRSAAAIAANGARALLCLVPEPLRAPAIEGLRGNLGGAGFALGLGLCAAMVVALVATLLRARPIVKALLAGALVSVVPPVLTAGFVVRYAWLPAALVAIAWALAARRSWPWIGGTILLAAAWSFDHVTDVREVRAGGALCARVIAEAHSARQAAGSGVPLAFVDVPDVIGNERDVPIYNWGLSRALRDAQIALPWQVLRTRAFVTSSDVELVDEARLLALEREGVRILRWQAATERFLSGTGGR